MGKPLSDDDLVNMTDEELMNLDPSTMAPAEPEQAPEGAVETEVVDEAAATPEPEAPVTEEESEGEPTPAGDEAQGEAEGEEAAGQGDAAPVNDEGEEVSPQPEAKAKEAEKPVEPGIDYKAMYEKLTAPFKANGREFAVKDVDDAIALMQMGANYNKKMAALKPNLKLLKMLENNGLMSEEKLSFLIDLDKKNPDAINKLVKDSGLDPLDLSAEKASSYQPKTYAVDEREIELDTVLDEIKDSQAYTRTLDVVSNKWDGASKQLVANQPQLLKVINSHIESGVYDVISTEIERERVFGRLKGMSDLEAYRVVGDAIQARGGFDHLFQPKGEQGQQSIQPQVVQPKPKPSEDALRDKRRAASPAKPTAPAAPAADFNPLAMSDEEFEKVGLSKFL